MDLIIFFLLILLPGYLITRLFFEELDFFAIFPLSFVLGLGLLFPVSSVSYIFRLSFTFSFFLVFVYTAVLFLLVLKGKRLLSGLKFDLDFSTKLLLLLVFGVTVGMYWIKPNFDGDALFHLANIRKLAENSPVTPFEAAFPIEKVNPAYGFNLWYFVIAFVVFASKVDTTQVWSHLTFLLVPLTILSVFTFSRSLFKDKFLALTTVLVFVFLLYFSALAWEFRIIAYPDQIARHIALTVSLYLFWEYLFGKEKRFLLLTVFSGFLLSTIHLYSWLHLQISIGAFSVVSLFFWGKKYFNKSLFLLALPLVSIPYLILKLENAATVVGTVTLKKDAIILFNNFFIVNPFASGLMILLIFFSLGIMYLKYRKSLAKMPWLVFLLANSAAVVLLLYNPFVSRFVASAISYTYFHRLSYLYYQEFVLAAFVVLVLFSKLRTEEIPKKLKHLYLLFALGLMVLAPIHYNQTKVEDLQELEFRKLANFIKTNLPPRSVFLADYWTSYRIPAYTNNYIVASFASHMTPNVNINERIEASRLALSQGTTLDRTKEILSQFQVNYVVVNSEPKKRDISTDSKKFVKQRDFKEIYSSGIYKIYAFNKY